MTSLPDVATLANTREETLLKLWEGLGYYSRARNLQRAARVVIQEHSGRIPGDVPRLLQLPGIGRYTAGAIASIAFNQPAPILDGNVIRVLCRLHAWGGDPKLKPLNVRLWDTAAALVEVAATLPRNRFTAGSPAGACSALNQSLMELGATVCAARDPRCQDCPLKGMCRARKLDRVNDYPEKADRPSPVSRRCVVIVIQREDRFLVHQRPKKGVNAGFWEFLSRELDDGEAPADAASRWMSVSSRALQEMAPVRHSITRYRIRLDVFRVRTGPSPLLMETGGKWVSHVELQGLPLTAAHRRIARQIASVDLQQAG